MESNTAIMLDDACFFLLREESHLAVGGWVYIETPARKMVLNHSISHTMIIPKIKVFGL